MATEPVSSTGLDPMVLSFDNQATADGPTMWGLEVQSDATSATQIVVTNQATNTSFNSTPMNIISIEALNLDAQSEAIGRICGYGASAAGGQWWVDNLRVFTGGCSDGIENSAELGVDCGGPLCPSC